MEDPNNEFSSDFDEDAPASLSDSSDYVSDFSAGNDFSATENPDDFMTKIKNMDSQMKWIVGGCGGFLLLCMCCFITMVFFWYTGDAIVETLGFVGIR